MAVTSTAMTMKRVNCRVGLRRLCDDRPAVIASRASGVAIQFGRIWIVSSAFASSQRRLRCGVNLAQNLGSPLGKILRIDPLEQAGGDRYGIPSDNPFVGTAGALAEVWALGLRHPQTLSFDTGGSGKLLIGEMGQAQIE